MLNYLSICLYPFHSTLLCPFWILLNIDWYWLIYMRTWKFNKKKSNLHAHLGFFDSRHTCECRLNFNRKLLRWSTDHISIFAMLNQFSIFKSRIENRRHTRNSTEQPQHREWEQCIQNCCCNVSVPVLPFYWFWICVVIWNFDEPNGYHWHLQT